jgi:Zn finger protein HypA/HybF involved in hydrogenase expression
MKPKIELQKKIVQLSEELPDLNKDQLDYAREELFIHKATLLKSGRLTCLDCAHQWKTAESNISNVILGVTCPKCKRKLEVEQTRKRVFADEIYYQVIQTYKGYQVSRMFKVFKRWKVGEKQRFRNFLITGTPKTVK